MLLHNNIDYNKLSPNIDNFELLHIIIQNAKTQYIQSTGKYMANITKDINPVKRIGFE